MFAAETHMVNAGELSDGSDSAVIQVAWLSGGGGRTGPRPLILTVTPVM